MGLGLWVAADEGAARKEAARVGGAVTTHSSGTKHEITRKYARSRRGNERAERRYAVERWSTTLVVVVVGITLDLPRSR